tara:strand:- start:8 stop:541 length:534 start_codon:yes stop_codon:yes gene_type:complete
MKIVAINITSLKQFFKSTIDEEKTIVIPPKISIGKYICHSSDLGTPYWTKNSGIIKKVDERATPQTNPPQLIVLSNGSAQTILIISQKKVSPLIYNFFSGLGTIFNNKIKLTTERTVINQKIPSKPIDSPKIEETANASANAIPILMPIAAFALVLTSDLVRSEIKANIVELIAPVP